MPVLGRLPPPDSPPLPRLPDDLKNSPLRIRLRYGRTPFILELLSYSIQCTAPGNSNNDSPYPARDPDPDLHPCIRRLCGSVLLREPALSLNHFPTQC